jgi:hypothetical protein
MTNGLIISISFVKNIKHASRREEKRKFDLHVLIQGFVSKPEYEWRESMILPTLTSKRHDAVLHLLQTGVTQFLIHCKEA